LRRKLVERGKSELPQEPGRGHQKTWPTATTESWILSHQAAGTQRLDDRVTVHAANRADVGARNGLFVGHDRQRFKRRLRQRLGCRLPEIPLYGCGAARRRDQRQLLASLLQAQPAWRICAQHGARSRQPRLRHAQQLSGLSTPQRRAGHKQQRDQLIGIVLGSVVPHGVTARTPALH
jgi:hypothetical protein